MKTRGRFSVSRARRLCLFSLYFFVLIYYAPIFIQCDNLFNNLHYIETAVALITVNLINCDRVVVSHNMYT